MMNKCSTLLPEAIAIAGVGFGTAIAIRGWPSWPWPNAEGQTWAAWAAAIATFLAAAIALLVASGESRRRKRDQIAMAALYAAHLAPKLNRFGYKLRRVSNGAVFYDDEDPAMPWMKEELDGIEAEVDLQQLMQLVPLERQAAHRIARGLAIADMALDEIRRIVQPRATSQRYSLDVAGRLSEAADLIIVATETCEQLAAEYAIPPSGEELFGDP
jgi:hypothetical protein